MTSHHQFLQYILISPWMFSTLKLGTLSVKSIYSKKNIHLSSLAIGAPALPPASGDTLGPTVLGRASLALGPGAGAVLSGTAGVEAPTEAPLVGGVAAAFDWHTAGAGHVSCFRALKHAHGREESYMENKLLKKSKNIKTGTKMSGGQDAQSPLCSVDLILGVEK